MTEFLKNTLFPILDRGAVLVFPTEESARAAAVEYVLDRKKGILKDRCISFDTFSKRFYQVEGKSAVSEYDKVLFSEIFIESEAEGLNVLYDSSYPQMKEFLPAYIKGTLSDLDSVIKAGLKGELAGDFRFLRSAYAKFLKKLDLYDSGYITPAIPEGEDCSGFYLVSPDIYPKEIKLIDSLGDRIQTISIPENKAPLHVFAEEKAEIRNLFCMIRELSDKGVGLENIAISAAGFDRMKPYLMHEARLFDIPLSFMKGDSLSSSVPGRFLTMLDALYRDGCMIEDMRAFFLDPSFRFENPESVREFIAEAVKMSVASARDGGIDRYSRLSYTEGFAYSKFRSALESLMTETVPSKVMKRLVYLTNVLLGDNHFQDNDEDNHLFGMIQSHLAEFLDRAEKLKESGYNLSKPLMPIFIRMLSEMNYVSSDAKEGVKVYPFSQSASIPYSHHFIIGMNEKESSAVVRDGSFLTDFERAGMYAGDDITEGLIGSYLAFNSNVYISCSTNTSDGAALPLTSLSDEIVLSSISGDDSWLREASEKREGKLFRLQKEGFEKARSAALKKIRSDWRSVPEKDSDPLLSYTSVIEFEDCPFKYSLQYEYGLKNLPSYEITRMDRKEIGTRLHSVMERFFRHCGHDPEKNMEKYFDEEMETWKEGLKFSRDKNTGEEIKEKLPRGSASPSDNLIKHIRIRFLKNLIYAAKRIAEESEPYENGQELTLQVPFEEQGFILKGSADMVAVSKGSDSLIVYDYKTGRPFNKNELKKKGLQFYVYRFMLEKEGESVKNGKYVFLKDGVDKDVLEDSTPEDESIEMKRLISAAEEIRSGMRYLTDDHSNCTGCAFKAICRRNMVVR